MWRCICQPRPLQCHTCVVRRERVYEAAARLRVTSRRLLTYLDAQGLPHGSASSALSRSAAQLLATVAATEVLNVSAGTDLPKPRPWVPYWRWEHDNWSPESYLWREWDGPGELTTAEAAAAYRVAPATIRQWVHRGHLTPLRQAGRTVVFDARAVNKAALGAGDRNQQPGGPLVRDGLDQEPAGRGLSPRLLEQLVTTAVAAAAVGVAPPTIRSWRKRGHLRPDAHRGRTPLYRLNDVVSAARRPRHRPRRKPKP
ncbi:helix-turn-helix protein [Humibacillus xanthopallidus]|uniref:Helix-turn-helix protein n=1 Tax=Humibacillus xanthopallidus TaxID=412689 RepID=A0A543PKP8_9MICO|nr:helix-turn-helix protein [Humibacillus xanthopallidus]